MGIYEKSPPLDVAISYALLLYILFDVYDSPVRFFFSSCLSEWCVGTFKTKKEREREVV